MDIFISWHGKRSHAVAVALRDWLPQIVNDFKPWLSSSSIDKGARWSPEIAAKLASAKAGIFCLTPSNLAAPWILFEAGAISKNSTEKTYVCTLLVDLQFSDVTDPLAQFQATKLTKDDLLQLVKDLNGVLGEDRMSDAHVEKAFEKWWPDLEEQLRKLPPGETAPPPQRKDRELLEEVLDKVRELTQRPQPPAPDSSHSTPLDIIDKFADASVEPRRLRDIRNYLTHTGLDPEKLRNTMANAYKWSGFENAAEFNRALQFAADLAVAQSIAPKKDVTESGGKPTEAPKPADPQPPKKKP